MILATYQLSTAITPRQFIDSPIIGEGEMFMTNIIPFIGARTGDFRVSLTDYWGVLCFHTCGRMDIEIDYIPQEAFADILRTVADTFFVKMKLVQPRGHYDYLPAKVMPGEKRDGKEV